MDFYAFAKGTITPADMAIFQKVSKIMRRLPNMIFDQNDESFGKGVNQATCHLICRALADHFPVSVKDGYFDRYYEHSWLVTEGGTCLIDPYPVAGASPLIVAADGNSPWIHFYREDGTLMKKICSSTFSHRLEITRAAVEAVIPDP